MKQCGQCGTQNLDQQASCTGCGQPLPVASPSHALGGTLVLQPSEPPAPPPAPAVGPAPAGVPARTNNLKGTMIGMAPPTFSSPNAPAAALPAATAPSQPPAVGGNQPARAFSGTMLGMPAYPSPPPAPEAAQQPAGTVAGGAPRIASALKTVLGVARPGIAPLNPGQAKPAPAATPLAAPGPNPQGAPAAWQPPRAAAIADGPRSPRAGAPGRVSLTAALAMMGSAMLLVIAVLAFFMLRGHGSVTARASLDANGAEQLELSCSECPDGTKTWIDSSPVAFKAGKATLRLQAPLKVGENPIVLVLERPGRSREEIALAIPIEFRVRGSTDELTQDPPKVAVVASALQGSKLEIDGKPVAADPSGGSSRFDFDVSAELTGAEASVKLLERVVAYKATSPSGAVQSGKVEIRLGITPLVVDAPGASIIVGTKDIVLAGRTAPGAVLKVGAREVALDPEGRFVSKQPLSTGDNSFVVRSTLKDHAPRLVKVQVRRSDNLEREGSLARAMAQTSYAEVVRAGDSAAGRNVALEGQLFDLRHDGYSSVLLVDVKDGCKKGPCLAKVIYGVETQLEKGRPLKAFGKVVRFVDGPRTGQRIPEVRADLVVAGAP
jgi:hypothetical protein